MLSMVSLGTINSGWKRAYSRRIPFTVFDDSMCIAILSPVAKSPFIFNVMDCIFSVEPENTIYFSVSVDQTLTVAKEL